LGILRRYFIREELMSVDQFVFVGLNSKVVALDRDTGKMVWEWSAAGIWSGYFVSLLLDGDRLVAAVNGYLYCLNARTGRLLWENQMKGCGLGLTALTSLRGQTLPGLMAVSAAANQVQDEAVMAATHDG
jgi:outer membrane protein assembly factor BamB